MYAEEKASQEQEGILAAILLRESVIDRSLIFFG